MAPSSTNHDLTVKGKTYPNLTSHFNTNKALTKDLIHFSKQFATSKIELKFGMGKENSGPEQNK